MKSIVSVFVVAAFGLLTLSGCSDQSIATNASESDKSDANVQGVDIKKNTVVVVYDHKLQRLMPNNFLVLQGEELVVLVPPKPGNACMYPMCGGAFFATLNGVSPSEVKWIDTKVQRQFMDYVDDDCLMLEFKADELPLHSLFHEFFLGDSKQSFVEDRTFDDEVWGVPRTSEAFKSSGKIVFLDLKSGSFYPNQITIGENEDVAVCAYYSSKPNTSSDIAESMLLGASEKHETRGGDKTLSQTHAFEHGKDGWMTIMHFNASDFVPDEKGQLLISVGGTTKAFNVQHKRVPSIVYHEYGHSLTFL